jgi:uncharacterized protein (DUF362 family)/Pyruvate/2-oxoacid:ferredoxin oxidoreductase delta subunit
VSKVVLHQCGSYVPTPEHALAAVLAPLGGMARFVSPGQVVFIKPNLLSDHDPEDAVTTHPEIARAVIRAVRRCGGVPRVGDSPASAVKLDQVLEKTGYKRLCAEESVELVNLEKSGAVAVEENGLRFHVAKPVLEADVLVNLPKIKTHVLTSLTVAVKNLFGTLPGYQKAQFHKTYPRPREFSLLLKAINQRLKPALNIADGVIAMEGDGPSAGSPVQLGLLAASADAAALDAALCGLLRVRLGAVPYLGQEDAERASVEWTAAAPPANIARIRVPSTLRANLISKHLVRFLDPWIWIRPGFNAGCIRCGRCIKACPASALSMENAQRTPLLNPPACIGCCCCHEICQSHAVTMELSPLLRILRGGKPL